MEEGGSKEDSLATKIEGNGTHFYHKIESR